MNKSEVFRRLMLLANKNNVKILFVPFKTYDGRFTCRSGEYRIGIRIDMGFDDYIYNLAHELAHLYLHYDKGNMIENDRKAEYEEQADRTAKMLIDVLSIQEGE